MTKNNPSSPKSTARREHLHEEFKNYLIKLGLRQTEQRRIILDAVLDSASHVDAETITQEAKKHDSSLGTATVYRTLKMMIEAGILIERKFDGQRSRFEFADDEGHHHDHLICQDCGEILEFYDDIIEEQQKRIAASLGFELLHHKMELFARCKDKTHCEHYKASHKG